MEKSTFLSLFLPPKFLLSFPSLFSPPPTLAKMYLSAREWVLFHRTMGMVKEIGQQWQGELLGVCGRQPSGQSYFASLGQVM